MHIGSSVVHCGDNRTDIRFSSVSSLESRVDYFHGYSPLRNKVKVDLPHSFITALGRRIED